MEPIQGKKGLVRVIGSFEKSRVREIGGEIIELECRAKPRETWFGSKYREVRETEGSRNRDSTVITNNFWDTKVLIRCNGDVGHAITSYSEIRNSSDVAIFSKTTKRSSPVRNLKPRNHIASFF